MSALPKIPAPNLTSQLWSAIERGSLGDLKDLLYPEGYPRRYAPDPAADHQLVEFRIACDADFRARLRQERDDEVRGRSFEEAMEDATGIEAVGPI